MSYVFVPSHLRVLAVSALVLLLAACQTTELVGSGPVELTSHQQRHYEKYKSMDTDEKVFMLHQANGLSFIHYCTEVAGCEMNMASSVGHCETRFGGTCKVYATGNKIVWKK